MAEVHHDDCQWCIFWSRACGGQRISRLCDVCWDVVAYIYGGSRNSELTIKRRKKYKYLYCTYFERSQISDKFSKKVPKQKEFKIYPKSREIEYLPKRNCHAPMQIEDRYDRSSINLKMRPLQFQLYFLNVHDFIELSQTEQDRCILMQ